MRLYYTGASPDNLRQAREHAPSHVHGAGWTPQKMTDHDVPYFVDNGAYTEAFDMDAWLDALEQAKTEMPRLPDFIVWPDTYGDATATMARCRDLFTQDAPLKPRNRVFDRYVAFQPGRPLDELFDWAREMGADGIFLGGPQRWQRAHGEEIVRRAHQLGKRVHLGNPGGADGLLWAYRVGFDSADTTTVFQNQYWHYLDQLERATDETSRDTASGTRQTTLVTDGGTEASGTIVLVSGDGRDSWHHSVAFDGFEHETACGESIDCDSIRRVVMDLDEYDDLNDTPDRCDDCADSIRSRSHSHGGGGDA